MKLFFRLIFLILTQRFRSRCALTDPVDTSLRVFPNDLDALLHVNNGVYLTYADLGRTDLILRANVFGPLKKQGWYPVAAGISIEYRKSLTLGQRLSIRTQVICWDDRSVYLDQVFTHGETLVARMLVDARFLSRDGQRISPEQLLLFLGLEQASPEMPQRVLSWIESRRQT